MQQLRVWLYINQARLLIFSPRILLPFNLPPPFFLLFPWPLSNTYWCFVKHVLHHQKHKIHARRVATAPVAALLQRRHGYSRRTSLEASMKPAKVRGRRLQLMLRKNASSANKFSGVVIDTFISVVTNMRLSPAE